MDRQVSCIVRVTALAGAGYLGFMAWSAWGALPGMISATLGFFVFRRIVNCFTRTVLHVDLFEDDEPRIKRMKASGDVRGLIWVLAGSTDRPEVRKAAADALAGIGEPAVGLLADALKRSDDKTRTWLYRILLEIGAPAVEPLIALLEDPHPSTCIEAAEVLGGIGDRRGVKPLVTMLNDERCGVSTAAVRALGAIGDPAAVGALLVTAALRDEVLFTWDVMKALNTLGVRAVEPLMAALEDEDGAGREVAAWTLGEIRDTRAVDLLITVLQGGGDGERRACAAALGKMGDPRAVKPLIAALGDDKSVVRGSAAEALGKLGDRDAVEHLMAAFKGDRSFYVRWYAAVASEQLGWKPGRDETGARYWIAMQDWRRVIALGSDAVRPLSETARGRGEWEDESARHHDEKVRREAQAALNRINDRSKSPLWVPGTLQPELRSGSPRPVDRVDGGDTVSASLHELVRRGDYDGLLARLNGGADVDEIYGDHTPLRLASQRGRADMVKLLIERGGRCQCPAQYRGSALEWSRLHPIARCGLRGPSTGGLPTP